MNREEEPHRQSRGRHGIGLGRLARLTLKELRETLRDRRTIVTLVLMPLLVYPLLSIAFQKFLLSNLKSASQPAMIVTFSSRDDGRLIVGYLEQGDALLKRNADAARTLGRPASRPPVEVVPGLSLPSRQPRSDPKIDYRLSANLEEALRDNFADVAIRIRPVGGRQDASQPVHPGDPVDLEILGLASSRRGDKAVRIIERRLRAVNDFYRQQRLKRLGITHRLAPIHTVRRSVETETRASPYSLSTLVPLILILMTITGAVYPAIDLTAGERERGTLETLIAAPVPRMGLLLAKYVAVLTVAVLTATVNLVSMAVTVLSIGLGPLLFGEAGLSVWSIAQVFGLMILFAAFFSAVMLVFTSFSRSFKEAQAYLIPLMLVAIAPGILSMMPGIDLGRLLSVTPLINIVLLARDVFEQTADPADTFVVVTSTVVYALGAIAVAGRVFGTDAILYGSPGTWSDLFRRPKTPLPAPSLSNALLCLTFIAPVFILAASGLGRLQGLSIATRLMLNGLITVVLFGGIPLLEALVSHIRIRGGFRLMPVRRLAWLGALLLGLSLWPFVFEAVLLTEKLGLFSVSVELQNLAREITTRMRALSPGWILLSLAVIPALFEELFFRGYLFSALRSRLKPWPTILISALLFGMFHLVVRDSLAIERLLPTTLLGVVLGWVCARTGSVLPGIVLHCTHNSLLLMVAYYEPQLKDLGIGTARDSHLPTIWLIAAAIAAGVGLMLVAMASRTRSESNGAG